MDDQAVKPRLLDMAGLLGALRRMPSGAQPGSGERAPWLDSPLSGGAWNIDNSLLLALPPWIESAAAAFSAEGAGWLVYLAPRKGRDSYFPCVLQLGLPRGRYVVRSWDCGSEAFTGLETASAPPLLCGPPCSGAPLALRITRL